ARLLASQAQTEAPARATVRAKPEGDRRAGSRDRELRVRRAEDEPGRRAYGSDRLRQHRARGPPGAKLHGQPLVRDPGGREDRAGPQPEHPRSLHAHVSTACERSHRAARRELQPAPKGDRLMATKAASEIVIGPVITERTYQLYSQGRYTFKVL